MSLKSRNYVSNGSNNNNGGIGFIGLLTITFIVLKLLEKIVWSWIWVLSPLWIPILIAIIFALIVYCFIK